jgi:tetrapyrrole methylase family protein/MazG family protein
MDIETAADAAAAFSRFTGIVMKLRSPGGCPWDLEQSPASLRGDLIEETYECIEAIDEQDPRHIMEELGDLFLLVTMISYMHQQEGTFRIAHVLDSVSEKIIRRHPHVFGKVTVKDSAEVLKNWAQIKVEQEGRKPRDSVLDEVSRGLPPLDRAWKLQKKAAKAGFDWPNIAGVLEKIREELSEAEEAIHSGGESQIEEELGDLLFAAVNLCRYAGIEPSVALQKTNAKFIRRFQHIEKKMKEARKEMNPENLPLMDEFWEAAKNLSRQ